MDKDIDLRNKDMVSIVNEMTFRSFRAGRFNIRRLFTKLSMAEYTAIWILSRNMEGDNEERRIYLSDISEKLKMPMPSVSKMVRGLQDKGLVTWKHDGRGEDGTYILITVKGIRLATEQQDILINFYKSVIEKFGRERFVNFIKEIAELEQFMSAELNGEEVHDEQQS